jgi:hypothetical protein
MSQTELPQFDGGWNSRSVAKSNGEIQKRKRGVGTQQEDSGGLSIYLRFVNCVYHIAQRRLVRY